MSLYSLNVNLCFHENKFLMKCCHVVGKSSLICIYISYLQNLLMAFLKLLEAASSPFIKSLPKLHFLEFINSQVDFQT